jgi:hypothetical protein
MSADPLQEIQRVWGRRYCQDIELRLVMAVEELLGRVPSNEEVSRCGFCAIHPDGTRHYAWNGRPLFVMPPFMEWAETWG